MDAAADSSLTGVTAPKTLGGAMNDPATAELRRAYVMRNGIVPHPGHRRLLPAFFLVDGVGVCN